MSESLFQDLQKDSRHAYPRPQLQRNNWISLNGVWDFAFDAEGVHSDPQAIQWTSLITVPFSPETPASGVHETGLYRAVWYRRQFERPFIEAGQKLLLHFEAVDYQATVWINGAEVVRHEGGYTPFYADITHALTDHGPQEIVVQAMDDPLDLAKPRGKQDWKLEPHSIWYPRTTGIWQTVWLEAVPDSFIKTVRWTSNLENWSIGLEAMIGGTQIPGLTLAVCLRAGEQLLSQDVYSVVSGEVHRQIALSDPGIDDFRNELLWSPSSPNLIDVELELRDKRGNTLDRISSYTALRAIAIQGDRFILNGRPLVLRMVLDQGYWLDSGLTAPSDDALRQDVILAKKLGFNGVRKHQKIENTRYLYWADRLGLLVWEEMPSAYRFTKRSVGRLTREWLEVLNRDCSHPCIVAWVPFNESWGVPDLPDSPAQRHYVQALYHLTKTFDPTRPVIGNDGWESIATDIIGIHDYDARPERIGKRYRLDDLESHLLKRERPGGRMLVLGSKHISQPIMLTEFGGIALSPKTNGDWGYSRSESPEQLLERYQTLLETVRALPALTGFCYTQFTDTYQEANGLLFMDRTPKAPFDEIALATNGSRPDHDLLEETIWREQLMNGQAGVPSRSERS